MTVAIPGAIQFLTAAILIFAALFDLRHRIPQGMIAVIFYWEGLVWAWTSVVMLSRGTAEENRRMAPEQGFSFPVLTWDDAVVQQYLVPGTPVTGSIKEELTSLAAGCAGLG